MKCQTINEPNKIAVITYLAHAKIKPQSNTIDMLKM